MNRFYRVAWPVSLALIIIGGSLPAEEQSIGNAMVTFLNGQLNSRVGGGKSAHLAIEGLRVSGAEFCPDDLGADFPGEGDHVWGTLVTVISVADGNWSDSNPANACQPGDVMQFGGSAIVGSVSYPVHFTVVVQTVSGERHRPSAVYQQNLGGVRTVQSAAINLKQLSTGWVRIYRPTARVDATNTWKFTVVNNSSTPQAFTVMFDITTVSSMAATAANSNGSFFVFKVTTDGTVPCVVNNDNTIYVETAKGNEIYNTDDGGLGIRQITP